MSSALLGVTSSCCAQQPFSTAPIAFDQPQPAFPIQHIDPIDFAEIDDGPGNSILFELRDAKNTTPQAFPATVSRVFARAEFPECAAASAGGRTLESQCDVKTRWPDGSLRHALISFWVKMNKNEPAQIDFVSAPCPPEPAGLTKAEMLDFLDGKWDVTLTATPSLDNKSGQPHEISVREVLMRWGESNSSLVVRHWLVGPIATQIILEDPSPLTSLDFGWKYSGATLESTGPLPNNGVTIAYTAPTSFDPSSLSFPFLVSIRQEALIICAATPTSLHVCPEGRGALGTIAVTHPARTPILISTQWEKAHNLSEKSLHPIFSLTFYPGWNGLRVETVVENTWIDRIQDQQYSLRMLARSPTNTTEHDHKALIHPFGTRWRMVHWCGSRTPDLRIDHNLPYMIRARVVPSYDLTIDLRQDFMLRELSKFALSDRGKPMGLGIWQPIMTAAGGRPDIGLIPAWYVHYLYTWDSQMKDLVEAQAGVSAHVPIHFRESAQSIRRFNAYSGVSAASKVLSLDARPTFFALGPPPFRRPETMQADRAVQAGPISQTTWTPDIPHSPSMVYLPYVLTGDWYLLEELHFWASYGLFLGNPGVCSWCRMGSIGYLTGQIRGQAWALRNLVEAIVMTPDATPEKSYFHSKLQNNVALREGFFDLREGLFFEPASDCAAPCRQSLWRVGRDIVANGWDNPLKIMEYGNDGLIDVRVLDKAQLKAAGSPWMMNFVHATLGLAEDFGFGEVGPLRRTMAEHLIGQLLNRDFNPYLVDSYRIGTLGADGTPMKTWQEVLSAYLPIYKERTAFPPSSLNCADCYANIAKGTSSWLVGISTSSGLSGTEAFLWLHRNLPINEAVLSDPRWSILPRRVPPELGSRYMMTDPKWVKRSR